MHGFKLEFECIDNVEKYKSIMLGLEKTRKMGVKKLKMFWDSNLIIGQV